MSLQAKLNLVLVTKIDFTDLLYVYKDLEDIKNI